ncbi:MAG: hypothetical protein ACOX1T_00830 [Saccharofermentanales bacterium]
MADKRCQNQTKSAKSGQYQKKSDKIGQNSEKSAKFSKIRLHRGGICYRILPARLFAVTYCGKKSRQQSVDARDCRISRCGWKSGNFGGAARFRKPDGRQQTQRMLSTEACAQSKVHADRQLGFMLKENDTPGTVEACVAAN